MSHPKTSNSWQYIEEYIEQKIDFSKYNTEAEIQGAIKDLYDSEYLRLGLSGKDPRKANIIRAYWNRNEAFRSTGAGQRRLSDVLEAKAKVQKQAGQWAGRIKRTSNVEGLENLKKELPSEIAPELMVEVEEQQREIEQGVIAEKNQLVSDEVAAFKNATTVDEYRRVYNASLDRWDALETKAGKKIPTPDSIRRIIREKTKEFSL